MTLGTNQKITADELQRIRQLNDFDLTMLLSEVHDHGWPVAKETLKLMPDGGGWYRRRRAT